MSDGRLLRLGVLISGRGSNMLAIARACRERRIAATIAVVISDEPAAAGLASARDLGLDAQAIDAAAYPTAPGSRLRPGFEAALEVALAAAHVELIVLAGFMRVLSAQFVARHEGRILNIHPSLLPDYKGLHTHRRVLAAGEREHGASVHYVTAQLDGGPVVLQSRLAVAPGDDEASLSGRIQTQEHSIYPRVIGWIASGRLAWQGGRPVLDGQPLAQPMIEHSGRGHS